MENPEESVAVKSLVKLATDCGARLTADNTALQFDIPELLKFSEKISEQVFRGTCNMIIAAVVQMVKNVGQEVTLAKSVTEGELDGTSRTGSH